MRGLVLGPGTGGGVLVPLPLPLSPTKFGCDLDVVDLDEDSVVDGEPLSNHELSVDVDLFVGRSLVSPSLLELPDDADASAVFVSGGASVVAKEAFDRRRRLRSLRKDGMVGGTPARSRVY